MIFARKAALATGGVLLILGCVFMMGCGSTYRPIASPVNSAGGNPQSTYTVAAVNQDPVEVGTVTFIDVSGDTNSGNIPAGLGVASATYDYSRNKVYVPNTTSKTLSVLTGSTGSSSITITLTPGSMPSRVFPVGAGYIYSVSVSPNTNCPTTGSVGQIDNSSVALLRDICVGVSPVWAVFNANSYRLYVADSVENKIYVIDTITPKLLPNQITVGTNPVWMTISLDGNYLYVVNQGSADISVIDTTAGTVVGTIPVGDVMPIKGYFDLKLNRLYVMNQGSDPTKNGSVSAFDASGFSTLTSLHAPIATGVNPVEITGLPDGSRVYTANSGENTVTQIDTGVFHGSTVAAIDNVAQTTTTSAVNYNTTSVGVSTDGSKVYASLLSTGTWNNGTASLIPANMTSGAVLSSYTSGFIAAPCQHVLNITDLVARDGGTGTLPAGTYYYVISVLDSNGSEITTLHSNEVTIAVDGSQATELVWTQITGATSYNVYRSTASGSEKLLVSGLTFNSTSGSAATFYDDGSITQSATAVAVPTGCLRQSPIQLLGWK